VADGRLRRRDFGSICRQIARAGRLPTVRSAGVRGRTRRNEVVRDRLVTRSRRAARASPHDELIVDVSSSSSTFRIAMHEKIVLTRCI
jgi:hypothetical protein